jgi:polygalacturonase
MIQTTLFNVADFGAVPDGSKLCTDSFREVINACAAAGGGTVYIPSGMFLTGPIQLRSNVSLYLDTGARVIFSPNKDDYPLIDSRWEGVERQVYCPQIFGSGLENIAVVGQGVFDGQGDYWWNLFRDKKLEYPRPKLISFENCSNIKIEGITLLNSPSWTLNPIRCQNVTIHQVMIKNPADSPNTDGINPESCQNVHISNCHLDVGDDCITLKAGTEKILNKVPCENVTISNCTMIHGHGGVVIGSETSGDIRNVVISNCVFEGTDRGIRIKSRRGRGGVIEDVRANNLIMKNVICPFALYMFYECGEGGTEKAVWDKEPYPVNKMTPVYRRIHFSNITATDVSASAGFIYGLPEMPISDITFDNVFITMAENANPGVPAMMSYLEPMKRNGLFCCNTKNVYVNNLHITGNIGPAFSIQKTENLELARCSAQMADWSQPVIHLEQVIGALIHGCKVEQEMETFLELSGQQTQQIEIIGNSRFIGEEQVRLTNGAQSQAFHF